MAEGQEAARTEDLPTTTEAAGDGESWSGAPTNGRSGSQVSKAEAAGPVVSADNGHAGPSAEPDGAETGRRARRRRSSPRRGSNGTGSDSGRGAQAAVETDEYPATSPSPSADDPSPRRRPAPDQSGQAARYPSYVSLGRSTVNHLRLVITLSLVGLLLGALFGVLRPPRYSAEARLIVGKGVNITNEAAIAGLAPAEAQFAADYSRLISTQNTMNDVAAKLGRRGSIGGSVTASPIPNSNFIRVDAKAGSQEGALAIANAGAAAIVNQVNLLDNENQSALNSLLEQYQQTQVLIGQYNQQRATLQAQIAAGGPATASLENQLIQLNSQINLQTLKANALQSQYQAQYSPVLQEEQVVTLAGLALPLGSDRKTFLEIGVAAGLLGGFIVGVALAAMSDMRRPRTSRRPASA